jgi:hypothetical protein
MSTLTDTVELEAALAEHELADELTEADVEAIKEAVAGGAELEDAIATVYANRLPEADPSPATEELGEPTTQQLGKLEREQARHEARVREIMGGHVAGFEPCDHCGGVGLVPPGPRPQTHEWFKACETCNGFGEVLTGSQREGQQSRDCPTCKGRGYLEALTDDGTPLASSSTGPQPIPTPTLEPVALEPATNGAAAPRPARFGTPAWMGDPSIGG